MSNNNTLTGRIISAMALSDYRQKDLAKLTGLDKRYISRLLSGEWDNPDKHLGKIADALGVNEYWLRTGEGDSAKGVYDTLRVELDEKNTNKIKMLLKEILAETVDKTKADKYYKVKFLCSKPDSNISSKVESLLACESNLAFLEK